MSRNGKYYLSGDNVRVDPLMLQTELLEKSGKYHLIAWLADGWKTHTPEQNILDFTLFSMVTATDYRNFRVVSRGAKAVISTIDGCQYHVCTAENELTIVQLFAVAKAFKHGNFDRAIVNRVVRS